MAHFYCKFVRIKKRQYAIQLAKSIRAEPRAHAGLKNVKQYFVSDAAEATSWWEISDSVKRGASLCSSCFCSRSIITEQITNRTGLVTCDFDATRLIPLPRSVRKCLRIVKSRALKRLEGSVYTGRYSYRKHGISLFMLFSRHITEVHIETIRLVFYVGTTYSLFQDYFVSVKFHLQRDLASYLS